MEIVLVHWYIKAGREDEFRAARPTIPPGTPGFIEQTLYQSVEATDSQVSEFVNVGRWETQADFWEFLRDATAQTHDFEARPRRREWFKPANSN